MRVVNVWGRVFLCLEEGYVLLLLETDVADV